MKPEKQLDLLAHYYYLQMRMAQEMADAYHAHTNDDEQGVLYSLLEYEYIKYELEKFFVTFAPTNQLMP